MCGRFAFDEPQVHKTRRRTGKYKFRFNLTDINRLVGQGGRPMHAIAFFEDVRPRLAVGDTPRTATEGIPAVQNPITTPFWGGTS